MKILGRHMLKKLKVKMLKKEQPVLLPKGGRRSGRDGRKVKNLAPTAMMLPPLMPQQLLQQRINLLCLLAYHLLMLELLLVLLLVKKKSMSERFPKQNRGEYFVPLWRKKRNLFKNANKEDIMMAYDGEASAYSCSNPVQFECNKAVSYQFTFEDELEQRTKNYVIVIELVKRLPLHVLLDHVKKSTQMSSMPAQCSNIFQMLEVMFNYYSSVKYEVSARNRFFSQSNRIFGQNYAVSGIKEGVVGFFSSLRPVEGWKDAGVLMLNVDVAHAAFYRTQHLMDFLGQFNIRPRPGSRDNLDSSQIKKITNELIKKDIRIVTTHTSFKRRYKVTGISDKTPQTHTFQCSPDGKTTNVEQYFRDRYNYQIRFPHLQCLKVGNQGNHMPMEVCEIAPNQRVKGELTGLETAEFIKQTAVPPHVRLNQVKNVMAQNRFDLDPVLKQLGVSVSDKPESVEGRVLPPPMVEMANSKTVMPVKGVWDVRGNFFNKTGQLDKWAAIDFSQRGQRTLPDFIGMLQATGRRLGLVTAPPLTVLPRADPYRPSVALNEIMHRYKEVNLILCVIENGDTYKMIKGTGDRELHVITQCVLAKNVFKCSPATVSNLLFKINAKLGGINHFSTYNDPTVGPSFKQLFVEPVLVMGADVNHPPAHDKSTPSLVAVVGSLDRNATKYALEVRHQEHRKEMIVDMKNVTVNLMKQFRNKTGSVPKRIIMFRDGVSESQFVQMLRNEMRDMRAACTSLHKDFKPAITFICVQKRHHTRLYCQDSRDGVGKSGNVPPGTVVDSHITHKTEADFYLCSHQGIQGTSKPSHYTVLWDDSDFTMNQLQILTYALCHNYSRCSRSVSIPTPAYYAHLAAFRAKVHLEGSQGNDSDRWSQSASEGHDCAYPDEDLKRATFVDINTALSDRMYYV